MNLTTKNPRNLPPPSRNLLLPRTVTLVWIAGKSCVSVTSTLKVIVSPSTALVIAVRRSDSLLTGWSAASARTERAKSTAKASIRATIAKSLILVARRATTVRHRRIGAPETPFPRASAPPLTVDFSGAASRACAATVPVPSPNMPGRKTPAAVATAILVDENPQTIVSRRSRTGADLRPVASLVRGPGGTIGPRSNRRSTLLPVTDLRRAVAR